MVIIGNNCWAGCGGLYRFSCCSSLALINRGKACGASTDRVYINRVCIDGVYTDKAYINRAFNIIYSKSPISLGNSGFIYIKGPIKIPLSL